MIHQLCEHLTSLPGCRQADKLKKEATEKANALVDEAKKKSADLKEQAKKLLKDA
jgi:hypothetical protein